MPHTLTQRLPLAAAASRILMAVAACGGIAGCKLVDQRSFDASAGLRPVPRPSPAPAPAGPGSTAAPLASVRFGAAPETWQPGLRDIVRLALARKPEALFQVRTLVPARGTPQDQAASLADVGHAGGQAVAEAIIAAGADARQVEIGAASDTAVTQPEVRVYVR